jgi:aminoglycoside 6'-N-acetyltransferase I
MKSVMKMTIREMGARDRTAWSAMRAALWPDETAEELAGGIDEILRTDDAWGFIAETPDGAPIGFAELAIRRYANGCATRPVAFLEGVWVRADVRRQGIGTRLIRHVAASAASRGFREMGSDAEIENRVSHAAHLRWGFAETERVVYFRMDLDALIR